MNYYIDTEFIEGPQRERLFGIPTLGLRWDKYDCLEIYRPYTSPTIDLISIGIVAEDGREYYAISKDFNLREAWNRFDLKSMSNKGGIGDTPTYKKVYWLRENVLKPIYNELLSKRGVHEKTHHFRLSEPFSYSSMKYLLSNYGKTNKEIAADIIDFTHFWNTLDSGRSLQNHPIKFYAYYADYDWVVFCWLFGKMMDLPKNFPMYCNDLKQRFDEVQDRWINMSNEYRLEVSRALNLYSVEIDIKKLSNYPKQENEHNALDDASWNKKLHEFLNEL